MRVVNHRPLPYGHQCLAVSQLRSGVGLRLIDRPAYILLFDRPFAPLSYIVRYSLL